MVEILLKYGLSIVGMTVLSARCGGSVLRRIGNFGVLFSTQRCTCNLIFAALKNKSRKNRKFAFEIQTRNNA